jgi:ribonuclease BN (tRNA processing enzyme)
VAREANVRRVVLTHFDPVLEISPEQLTAARRIFPHVELGADHLEIDL